MKAMSERRRPAKPRQMTSYKNHDNSVDVGGPLVKDNDNRKIKLTR